MEQAAVPGAVCQARLEGWIGQYADAILRVCFLYLGDRDLAQDAMQDTFFKAWRAMDRFEKQGESSERAWLMRIAVNTCRDYRRGQWFRHVDFSRSLDDLPPRLIAEEAEDRAIYLDVARLPEKQKQVILLHYFQNFTLQETAQILGIPKSTAYKRLARAEQMLRQALTGGDSL